MGRRIGVWLVVALLVAGCREGDAPLGDGFLFVSSSPQGGSIFIDDVDMQRTTPDTLEGLAGMRNVRVELRQDGIPYRYTARVLIPSKQLATIHGPLLARCSGTAAACAAFATQHVHADISFASNAMGGMFAGANNTGILWPAGSGDGYGAGGMPLFAARESDVPVALGVYDLDQLGGRPGAQRGEQGGAYRVEQLAWVLPPLDLQPFRTPRGLEIRERMIAAASVPGVVLVELQYRNISTDPDYQRADAGIPETGVTFADAFLGLGLDPDIGDSVDDWVSYDAQLDAVFLYDSNFSEGQFQVGAAAPALVGMRVLRRPEAGGTVVLNAWLRGQDWNAGTASQAAGYSLLTGSNGGFATTPAPGDLRISATAGPVTLAPGDVASIVIAVALARPTEGTFEPGMQVAPGDPADSARPLYAIAAGLRQKLVDAESLLVLLP